MTRSDPAATEALRLTRRFAAPREVVFRAWTDPEALVQWFGPKGAVARDVKVDLRPGGRYSLTLVEEGHIHPLSGVYREIEAPERLVFTWTWGHGDFADVETLVTLDFVKGKDGGTLLTLIHERLPNARARELHQLGWESTLESLADHILI